MTVCCLKRREARRRRGMKRVTAEWVVVSDETAIVSCETGDFWFLDLKGYGDCLLYTSDAADE